MLKQLTGRVWHHLLKSSPGPGYRVVSSAAVTATDNETVADNYYLARPYKKMPKITFFSMMWDSFKDPTIKLRMDKWFEGFFTKSGGSIYRVWIPGLGDRVFIKDPKDIQTLLAQCHCFYARRQPVSLRSDFFAPKYPVLNSGTIIEFLSKNETIVIIYYYAIYFL